MKILLVEPDRTIRNLAQKVIEKAGHAVVSTSEHVNGYLMIEKGDRYDCIVAVAGKEPAGGNPTKPGLMLLRMVRKHSLVYRTPFVLMDESETPALDDETSWELICAEHRAIFLKKPWDPNDELLKAIEQATSL